MVGEVVMAISTDNRRMHVGRGLSVVAHLLDDGGIPEDMQLFDETGQELALDRSGNDVVAVGDAPDDTTRRVLTHRIDTVQAHIQLLLTENPLEATPASPIQPTLLPRVSGELRDVMRTLAWLTGDLGLHTSPSPGDTWHKIWYHVPGRAH